MPELSIQTAVRQFMELGGQRVNRFDAKQAALYTGLQLEELVEKLSVIKQGTVTLQDERTIEEAIEVMSRLADRFKAGLHMGDVLRSDRCELLDADIDLAWVSIGAAYSTSCDTEGAIAEVIRANMDKFPGGVVIRDENGKIRKPAAWRPPNLMPFVDQPID